VTCLQCAPIVADLQERLADLTDRSEAMLLENSELHEEVAGNLVTIRKISRELGALRAELTRRAEESPEAKQIRRVLDHWAADHPRAKTPTGGARWKTVAKALRLDHTVDELLEAVDGLRTRPYVTDRGRSATGSPSQRYDDLTIALRDESTIARFRGYAQSLPEPTPDEVTGRDDDGWWQHLAAQDQQAA